QDLTVLNGVVYFSADDDVNGRELWYANGATTDIVKDIYAGSTTSYPMNFAPLDGFLYFRASDPVAGVELWRTDGTEAGTTLVKDINPTGDSNVGDFYLHDGYLYFYANDGTTGFELWRTNGTTAGTQLVENLADGDDSSSPDTGVSLGDYFYFSAYDQVNDARYVYRTSGSSIERVPFNLDPAQYINCDCYDSNIFAAGVTLFSTSYSVTYGYEFSYLIEPTADLPSTNREGEQGTIALVLLAALTAAAGLALRLRMAQR
ncbi:MAG: ELWxxDGT repeat protein, partial [Candidatus Limnocylindrus sp.]